MGRCRVDNQEMLYVVMEYAAENLSQVLLDRPLTPAEARDMLRPALEGLAYLHGKRLVHGHIRPGNIMAIDDRLKISSDGICEVGELSASRDEPSMWDAPEVAGAGKSPAGDVWSLGVTLVEVLTQHIPRWERADQEEPVLPETLPAPFVDIVRDCLRRDPRLRCTVADIAARLQPPSSVPPARVSAKPVNAPANRRYIAPAIVAVLAVAIILAAPRLVHKRPETGRISSVPPEQPKPKQKPQKSQTGQPTGKITDRQVPSNGGAASPAPIRLTKATNTHAGSLVRGEVAHQVLPDVPQKARDSIRGTIRVGVKVQVDPSGSVVGTSLDSPGPSKYFANLAADASRRWRFTPTKVDGQNAPSEWILRFEFTQVETKVTPVQTAP
jgi:TonB family protein